MDGKTGTGADVEVLAAIEPTASVVVGNKWTESLLNAVAAAIESGKRPMTVSRVDQIINTCADREIAAIGKSYGYECGDSIDNTDSVNVAAALLFYAARNPGVGRAYAGNPAAVVDALTWSWPDEPGASWIADLVDDAEARRAWASLAGEDE